MAEGRKAAAQSQGEKTVAEQQQKKKAKSFATAKDKADLLPLV
jgi:hypothetical protein